MDRTLAVAHPLVLTLAVAHPAACTPHSCDGSTALHCDPSHTEAKPECHKESVVYSMRSIAAEYACQ